MEENEVFRSVSSAFIIATNTWQTFNNYLLGKYVSQGHMNSEADKGTQLSTTKRH